MIYMTETVPEIVNEIIAIREKAGLTVLEWRGLIKIISKDWVGVLDGGGVKEGVGICDCDGTGNREGSGNWVVEALSALIFIFEKFWARKIINNERIILKWE